MKDQTIQFHFEGVDNKVVNTTLFHKWLKTSLVKNKSQNFFINYIFCTDEYLLGVNREYLDHDFYTDIITFNNSENEGFLESDIFISVDRVLENAKDNKVEFECEIARVMIHGILHLIGFNDKTEEEQNLMTRMENENLSLHPELNC
jgi:rRNA maturation RNase YbeY|tara:strand:+ start:27 stop:467 length:441 start_codon:yes stop_codon:yes gene_type:complete